MGAEEGQPSATERILIVSLDNLGDLVFASALLTPIRERFPVGAHRGYGAKAIRPGSLHFSHKSMSCMHRIRSGIDHRVTAKDRCAILCRLPPLYVKPVSAPLFSSRRRGGLRQQ